MGAGNRQPTDVYFATQEFVPVTPRPLNEWERSLIERLLDKNPFHGRDEVRRQVPLVRVVEQCTSDPGIARKQYGD